MANKLNPNDDLAVIKTITSLDGRFNFSLQTDGNLVLYGPGWEPIWSSGTYGKTIVSAIMQADGNLVLYGPGAIPVWSTGTYGNPGSWLCVQDDGNIIINNAAGKPIWSIPPAFIDTKSLITQLISLKASDPAKKIAFVFSGGGARAAWFGGVLEAIEREVRNQQPNVPANQRFAPDLLVGTSGGSLAAVGYFADLMNPGNYGPYANRQSWLWREIARNNEAAFRLLENPGVLELISGSRVGKGKIDWSKIDKIIEKPLSTFAPIANIPNAASPTFMSFKLFKSVKELMSGAKAHEEELNVLYASFHQLKTDFEQIISRITVQDLTAPWTGSLGIVKNSLGGIRSLADKVWDDIDFIKNKLSFDGLKPPSPSNIKDAIRRANGLIFDGGAVVNAIIDGLSNLNNHLLNIPLELVVTQYSDIKKLFETIKKVMDDFLNLLKAMHPVTEAANALGKLSDSIGEVLGFIKDVLAMVSANSSLMNTTGLKNAFHEVLRMVTPSIFEKDGKASDLDKTIFDYWNTQRNAKLANPFIRAPELIFTTGNITANRLALLTLCDGQSALNLSNAKRWVIGLNLASSGFIRGSKIQLPVLAEPANPKDPHHWLFGAWSDDYVAPVPDGNTEFNSLKASESRKNRMISNQVNPAIPTTRGGLTLPKDCPFEHPPGISFISGTSIIAGAALTTSAIPIAFPPRLWRFENPFLKKVYHHWFVDGGICDNRPIEHAIDAGADYIVSFELSPLRKAITDIPTHANRPNIIGMVSASLIDTPIDSAFKRFIESYVANNQPPFGESPKKKIWRIAPDAGAGEEDETIGVYDFNGYWNNGEMKTGLFDWFMRGYLDGCKNLSHPANPNPDPVSEAYNTMPEYGQKNNASQKKETPGYFAVDFFNNKPHPGYL